MDDIKSKQISSAPSEADPSTAFIEKTDLKHIPNKHPDYTGIEARFPVWKRFLDLALIILTAPLWLPLMILLAATIKLSSPGPLLFRQKRIGFRGQTYICLKFRSMKIGSDTRSHEELLDRIFQTGGPMTKLDALGDPRLIRFGPLFRATGLDELPQIFNVIRGEMSLVGPRPCTPYEFERYQPAQKIRVNVPPGLTGYWQVNGKNKTTLEQMIALDAYYVEHLSPGLDAWILARTFPTLLAQAYETLFRARTRIHKTQQLGEISKG